MSMSSATQGTNIELRVKLLNASGFLSNSSDIVVDIYPYGYKPGLPYVTEADALVLGAEPDNEARGKYLYTYAVQLGSQVGIYYAHWHGTLNDSSTFSVLDEFLVLPSEDGSEDTQYTGDPTLVVNNIYRLELHNIGSTDDLILELFTSWFTSQYTPMYTTYENIISLVGEIVVGVQEDTINYLIWQASLEADNWVTEGYICNEPYLLMAKKKFVEFKVLYSLLANILGAPGQLESKSLGDLRVTYRSNVNALNEMIKNWTNEMEKWARVLNARGCVGVNESIPMGIVQQSIYSPDRATVGRQIREAVGSLVASNTKAIMYPRTRYQMSYDRPQHLNPLFPDIKE